MATDYYYYYYYYYCYYYYCYYYYYCNKTQWFESKCLQTYTTRRCMQICNSVIAKHGRPTF